MMKNKKGYVILALLAIICIAALSGKLFTNVSAKGNTVRCYTQIMVEEGDSLWSIAAEHMPEGYNIYDYIDELKMLNHIDGDIIKAGYKLTVFYEQPVG